MPTHDESPPDLGVRLGPYRSLLCAGVPVVAWGFPIVEQLGEDRLAQLCKAATVVCLQAGRWAVVTRWLSREDAEAEYGPVTSIRRGPRGGRQSITFGVTEFSTRHAGAYLLRSEEGGPLHHPSRHKVGEVR